MNTRILALFIRYKILVLGSFPRILSILWWPSIQIVLWGFFSSFLDNQNISPYSSVSVLLTAVILWDILFRGQLGLSITFFEEIWSRNLCHLFITPIKNIEIVVGLIFTSLIRTIIGLIPAIFISIYYFNLEFFSLGFYLIFFFFNLILTGWSIGFLVSGLVLRYGQAYEELAWVFIFLLLPFSCVYYPLSSLPNFIQEISIFISPVYVFEGMREILINKSLNVIILIKAIMLNLVYIVISVIFLLSSKESFSGTLPTLLKPFNNFFNHINLFIRFCIEGFTTNSIFYLSFTLLFFCNTIYYFTQLSFKRR